MYPSLLLSFFSRIFPVLLLLTMGCQRAPERSEIVLGIIASLTGPAGEQGQNWSSGASFAAAEWNAESPRAGPPVRLVLEDDGTESSSAVKVWQKLLSLDRVQGIMGGTWDFVAAPLYPLALSASIPFITPTNAEEIMGVDPTKNPFVFSSATTLAAESVAIRDFFLRERVRRVAVLYPLLPFGTAHADIVKLLARELSIEVVDDIAFALDASFPENIRIPASRLAARKPDCVFAVLDITGLDAFTKERARSKGKYKVLTTQHLDEAWRLSKDPPRYEGVFGVYPDVQDQTFSARYRAFAGKDPKVFASEGYDAMKVLIQLVLRNEKEFSVSGVSGTLTVKRGKRVSVVASKARIVRMKDGMLVNVAKASM